MERSRGRAVKSPFDRLLFWLVRQTELASFRTRLESDVSQRTDTIINKIDGSLLVAWRYVIFLQHLNR